jgi:hypothetical protein
MIVGLYFGYKCKLSTRTQPLQFQTPRMWKIATFKELNRATTAAVDQR